MKSVELSNRVLGAVIGFAVGDSLGFPAAGIRKQDFLKMKGGKIKSFTTNTNHPFFFKLKRGQYTDNTRLFTLALESLIQNEGYDEKDIVLRLKRWALLCREDPLYERWPGETTLKAALSLLEGSTPSESGVEHTLSCGAIYRTLPVGLYFTNHEDKKILRLADRCASITHNSPLSIAGASFSALSISKIIKGASPKTAFIDSFKVVEEFYKNKPIYNLIKKINFVISNFKNMTHSEAIRLVGTGSPITETLPLVIFITLKAKNFKEAVLLAANSFREDNKKEIHRLSKIGWVKQILECKGGNTDGIAATVGCFWGGFSGLGSIEKSFRKIEDYTMLYHLAQKLYTSFK